MAHVFLDMSTASSLSTINDSPKGEWPATGTAREGLPGCLVWGREEKEYLRVAAVSVNRMMERMKKQEVIESCVNERVDVLVVTEMYMKV